MPPITPNVGAELILEHIHSILEMEFPKDVTYLVYISADRYVSRLLPQYLMTDSQDGGFNNKKHIPSKEF